MARATGQGSIGSACNAHGRNRLLAAYSEQRRSLERSNFAACARALAAGVSDLVERNRAGEYGSFANLPQDGRERGPRWLGELRIRAHARVSLGNLPYTAR